MKPQILLITISFFISMGAFSQSEKAKLDKLHKDPTTAEQAAKADVYVAKDNSISDSTIKKSDKQFPEKKKRKKKTGKP